MGNGSQLWLIWGKGRFRVLVFLIDDEYLWKRLLLVKRLLMMLDIYVVLWNLMIIGDATAVYDLLLMYVMYYVEKDMN